MKTGISDIGIYIPDRYIDIDDIIEKREGMTPRMSKRISLSKSITEQNSIRFPRSWEDPVTLSAEAGRQLLERNPGSAENIRYIGTGTESSVDASKPVASYVHGLWQRSGFALSSKLSTFQSQHACASGTIALLATTAQLSLQAGPKDAGLILCSDIARYERDTTAEITQGAGSIALLIEKNPRLVEIDPSVQGLSSRDVDDFFRPHHSLTARVKGQYSMKCYQDSLIEAVEDYSERRKQSVESVLRETDYFILHSPFASMSRMALRHLYEVKTGKSFDAGQSLINMHALGESSSYISSIGNLYSGSIYLNLATTLFHQWQKYGDAVIGRKILFASYGSGNTMIVFSGTVAPRAGDVLSGWNIPTILQNHEHADFSAYEEWASMVSSDDGTALYNPGDVPGGRYYLRSIRSDGFREYDVQG